jgi:hypothetical protein
MTCSIVKGEYGLWRTESINLTVRYEGVTRPGTSGHLGWEDSQAPDGTQKTVVKELSGKDLMHDIELKEFKNSGRIPITCLISSNKSLHGR